MKFPFAVPKFTLSKGSSRFVLFLGDEGAVLAYVQDGVVAKRLFSPAPGAEATRNILAFINANATVPIEVLVEIGDQSYGRRTFPPVSSLSVSKLVKRQMERDYGREEIRGALCLGRKKDGHKEWDYLVVSLGATPQFQEWLAHLLDTRNPFHGIYLVPAEAQLLIHDIARTLAPRSGEPTAWQLLVAHTKVGGFRQVVLHHGQLIFTRLTQPLGEATPAVYAGNIQQEIINTTEYLRRLSFANDEDLTIYVVASEEINTALVQNSKVNAAAIHTWTPPELAEHLGLAHSVSREEYFADGLLLAHFAHQRKHLLKLHNHTLYKLDRLQNYRRWQKVAAWVFTIGLSFAPVGLGYYVYDTEQNIDRFYTQLRKGKYELQYVQQESRKLPEDIDNIINLVSTYEIISQEDVTPFTLVRYLEEVLSTEKGVVINSMRWSPIGKRGEQPGIEEVIKVEFRHNTGDVESFVAMTERFLQALQQRLVEYKVSYSHIPGIISEEEVLEVNFDENVSVNDALFVEGEPISVQVTIRGPHTTDDKGVR